MLFDGMRCLSVKRRNSFRPIDSFSKKTIVMPCRTTCRSTGLHYFPKDPDFLYHEIVMCANIDSMVRQRYYIKIIIFITNAVCLGIDNIEDLT